MVQIAICDDESTLRESLKDVLEFEISFHGLEYSIDEFESGESFLIEAKNIHYDILFLDIEMKKLSGMETAKKLREKNQKTIIIFITSYPDYVFQGYEVGALNYILKPYKDKKILKVFTQALKEIEALKEDYFVVEQKSGRIKIPYHEILYFKSEGRQIIVVSNEKTKKFYDKLDEISAILPMYFVRIHNRYIVNITYVSSLQSRSLLCGQERLPISRNYQKSAAISFAKKILR